MFPDSRGSVKMTSRDPRTYPALRFDDLTSDRDRPEWVESVRVARDILGQPAFEPFNDGELSPGPGVATDEETLDCVAREGETAYHQSCTAPMGTDECTVWRDSVSSTPR